MNSTLSDSVERDTGTTVPAGTLFIRWAIPAFLLLAACPAAQAVSSMEQDPASNANKPVPTREAAGGHVSASARADAQPPSRQQAGTHASKGYVPYRRMGQQRTSGSVAAVVAAYVLVWAILMLYLLRLHWRQNQLQRELEDLKRRMGDAKGPVDPPTDRQRETRSSTGS